jgi:hypothetical protein
MFRKLMYLAAVAVVAALCFSATASAAPVQKGSAKGQRFERFPGTSHGSFAFRFDSYHHYDHYRGFSERYLPGRSESFRYQNRFFPDRYRPEHVFPHRYEPSRTPYWMFFSW